MSEVFKILSAMDVNDKKSKKGKLDYLSWAHAWKAVKDVYPEANSFVYENEEGYNYFHDGRTAWVKVGMTIEGLEHIEYLPVMDFKNQSIPREKVTSMDVNKAIQRALVKAIARHGLGLYIYAGEDLPELSEEQIEITEQQKELEAKKAELRLQKQYKDRAKQIGFPDVESLEGKTSQEITAIIKGWQKAEGAKK